MHLTSRDRDFTWFLRALVVLADYYPVMKESGFLNKSVYSTIARDPRLVRDAEIMRQFDCLTPVHFRVAFAICQHLYARTCDVRGGAKTAIRRGIFVLYHYVYRHATEAIIVKQIEHLRNVSIVPIDKHSDNHVWTVANFLARYGSEEAPPRFIIRVPWTQVLTVVGRKYGACALEDGYALLVYAQTARWLSERWKCVVKAWKAHDSALIEPWLAQQQNIHQSIIDKTGAEMGRKSGPFAIWKTRYISEHFERPVRIKLLNSTFYDTKALSRPDFDPSVALLPLYTNVFALGRELEARAVQVRQSHGAIDLRNEAETGDFVADYGPIMPPCIKYMYDRAIELKTHYKDTERPIFFAWTFKAGIPLSSVENMWTAMCGRDANVAPRDVPALMAYPRNFYRKFELDRERGAEYNFRGCAKMSAQCIFNDIEDITERKSMCIGSTCTGRIRPAAVKWSPMLATIILHKQHYTSIS